MSSRSSIEWLQKSLRILGCANALISTSLTVAQSPEVQFTDIFDQIAAYAAGAPINVVNPEVLSRSSSEPLA